MSALRARRKTKNLERGFSGLHLLQAFEIAQNRQRILWKSLEKTGGYLEMFGKKLGGFQAQRRAAARSFAMLGAQRGSPAIRWPAANFSAY
jgi:hypothetical protein